MTEVGARRGGAELAGILAMAEGGAYLEAAGRCRAALELSPPPDEAAGLVALLEKLAYILRPQRGESPTGARLSTPGRPPIRRPTASTWPGSWAEPRCWATPTG